MGDDQRDDRAAEIVGEWQRARGLGDAPSPEDIVRRHPEIGAELREAFATLELLDRTCMDVGSAAVVASPASPASVHPDDASRVQRIGDFRIVREIGRGGMGVVYEAEQISMRRTVALKVLFPSVTTSAKAIERFRREAQATGRLHHTNVVQIHAMGSEAGQWYYAMEHVRGRALSDILADLRRLKGDGRTRTPADGSSPASTAFATSTGRREEYARIAGMFAGVADALATAHDAGVVHRDVKPSNLMLDETSTLKILDFGLASIREEPGGVTMTGDVLGTPAYMSPEQARAQPVDGRADVYSLGATLYEVLTLRPPVEGRDVSETLHRVVTRDPVRPRRLEARIPRDLETIVLKAIEKDSGRRYASASAFAHDLRAFAEGSSIAARRVGPLGRAWRQARRHPATTALLAGTVAAIVAAIVSVANAERADAARAHEAARRVELEYDTLLSRALMRVRDGQVGPQVDEDLFARAITLAPDRREAWFQRAIRGRARLADGLADLEAARVRGLPDTQYRLARSLLLRRHGRRDEALAEAAQVVDAPTSELELLVLRAAIASPEGRNAEAEQLLDRVIRTARPDEHLVVFDALNGRSDLRVRRGDYEGAIADLMALRAHVAADSPLPHADARIAWLWKRCGRPEAAERHVDAVLSSYESNDKRRAFLEFSVWCWDHGEDAWAGMAIDAGLRRHSDDVDLLAANLERRRLPAEERIAESDRILAARSNETDGDAEADSRRRHFAARVKIRALEELGRLDEAVAIAESLTKAPHPRADDWSSLAIALRRLGRFDDAEAAYAAARKIAPFDPDVTFSYATFLCGRDRLKDALEFVEEMIDVDRSSVAFHDLRSQILDRQGRHAEAIDEARQTLLLVGDHPGSIRLDKFPMGAAGILGVEHPAEVLGVSERLARDHPEDARARAQLAFVLDNMGEPAKALEVLERSPSLQPTWNLVYLRIGVLRHLGRMPEVLESAETLIRLSPQEPEGYKAKGWALVWTGEHAKAIESLERYLALAPVTPADRSKQKTGEDQINRVIEIRPLDIKDAHFLLGHAFVGTGDLKRALSEFDTVRASGIKSDHDRWMPENRARVLLGLDRTEEAEQAIREGLAAYPRDPTLLLLRCALLMHVHDWESAESAIRDANRLVETEEATGSWLRQFAEISFHADCLPEATTAADRALVKGERRAAGIASLARSLDRNPNPESRARASVLAEEASKQVGGSPDGLPAGAADAAANAWRESAEALFKAVEAKVADDFLSPALLARAYVHLGRTEDAARVLAASRATPGWPAHVSRLEKRVNDEVDRELAAAQATVPK